MKRRIAIFAAACLAASVALAGCGSGEESTTSTEGMSPQVKELYDKAVAEGSLTWYTSLDEQTMNNTVEAFEKTFPGVHVDALRSSTGQLSTRFSSEVSANAKTADIITTGDPLFVNTAAKSGWLTPANKDQLPAAAALDAKWFHDGFPTTSILLFGIGYNTNLVAEPPTQWNDILDPQYKGKTVMGDFRMSAPQAWLGGLWEEKLGPEFLERLKDQEPTLVDSMVPGAQMLASGQAAIGLVLPEVTVAGLVESGAPIAVAYPEWYSAVEVVSGVSASSTSPNLASLFLDWILTEDGQEVIVAKGAASPINSEGSIPLREGYTLPDYAQLDQDRAMLQNIFGLV